jgi:hypothetical protein
MISLSLCHSFSFSFVVSLHGRDPLLIVPFLSNEELAKYLFKWKWKQTGCECNHTGSDRDLLCLLIFSSSPLLCLSSSLFSIIFNANAGGEGAECVERSGRTLTFAEFSSDVFTVWSDRRFTLKYSSYFCSFSGNDFSEFGSHVIHWVCPN